MNWNKDQIRETMLSLETAALRSARINYEEYVSTARTDRTEPVERDEHAQAEIASDLAEALDDSKRPANPSTRDEPLQAPSCPRKPSWTPCLKKLPIRTTRAYASAASTARNSRLN